MTEGIIRRLTQCIGVLLLMSLLVFFGVYAIGDPMAVLIHPQADQIQIAEASKRLGLDRPVWEQYFVYLANLFRGDFGTSFVYNEPSLKVILQRLPATFELVLCSFVIAIFVGIPLGLFAGLRPQTASSRLIMSGSIFGFSVPSFWIGLMLIMVFAVEMGWLPSGGRGPTSRYFGIDLSLFSLDGLKHLILPAVNLGLVLLATVIRLTQSGTREVLTMDYIKFVRAKGLSNRRILRVHVLRNVLIPVVTILGLEFGNLIAFSVVTESVFAWPGIGKMLINSINNLDRPVVVAYLLLVVVIFTVSNLVVDILCSVLDPRIAITKSKA